MVPIIRGVVNEAGKLELSEVARGVLTRQLQSLAGKPVDVTVRVHRHQRSRQANRFYFGVVVPLLAAYCGYEKDEMHELLAMRFLRIADDPVTGSPRRTHTPETDSKEFADYVDACMRFGAALGVYIPNANEVAA